MQRITVVLALALMATGCGLFKRAFGVTDESAAHTEPTTTSPFGEWVLATPPDSTAFAGASSVELQLSPRAFAITATYPSRDPLVITGDVSYTDTGRLTFIPARSTAAYGTRGAALAFTPGEPITLLASAAGGSLVFSPDAAAFVPSSVWYRKDRARAAGAVSDTT